MKKSTLYTIIGFLAACITIAGAAFAIFKIVDNHKKKKLCFCDDCYDNQIDAFTPECYSEDFINDDEQENAKKSDGGIELDISLDENEI